MKLYFYQGLVDDEDIAKDATHMIAEKSITVMSKKAFYNYHLRLSIGENFKSIEFMAFSY